MSESGVNSLIGAGPVRACMLAYTFYENDGRVMRYAEALAQEGCPVDAIVLRRPGQPREETINGVRVLRIQERTKNERGKSTYLWRILRFFFRSMIEISRQHFRHPYDVVHVHSVPDFEVFAAIVPKLGGAKIILDIHDIVPEFYAAKFGVDHKSAAFKVLRLMERWSCSFVDYVIAANDIWREKITRRAVHPQKCTAFINYPDMGIFHDRLRTRAKDDRFVLCYPGTLNWHQGLDIAIRAFAIAQMQAPGMEFHIYGEGSARPAIEQLVNDLGLTGKVRLHEPLPQREIATVMANADVGVVPKRNDSFGGEAFSTKILEFMALGVPVIVAKTRIDMHYFSDKVLRFFTPSDENDLANAMLDAYRCRARSVELASNALAYARTHSWGERKSGYLNIVQRLIDGSA